MHEILASGIRMPESLTPNTFFFGVKGQQTIFTLIEAVFVFFCSFDDCEPNQWCLTIVNNNILCSVGLFNLFVINTVSHTVTNLF